MANNLIRNKKRQREIFQTSFIKFNSYHGPLQPFGMSGGCSVPPPDILLYLFLFVLIVDVILAILRQRK